MTRLSRVQLSAVLVVAFALFMVTLADSPARATTFSPEGGFTVDDTSAGANSDVTIDVMFEAPDALFSSLISFLPPEWGIGTCPANDAASAAAACAGESMAVGEIVGEDTIDSTLGLLNNPCLTGVPLLFEMMNATLDMGVTVVFHDTDDDGVGEMFEDADENSIPDGAELWPDFISRLIRSEPFPGGEPLEPIMRLYGQVEVGGTPVGLQYVILEPGTTINGLTLDASLGFPIVLLLQDIGDPGATRSPSTITDFCSPLGSSLTIFGLSQGNVARSAAGVGDTTVLTNPADGGFNLVTFISSEYDNDGDGIPNPIDPCALTGNTLGWDPRVQSLTGDADGDGLPDLCDPTPDVLNTDEDGDGWPNRGDNCPIVANADQSDVDRDSLGDVCDDDAVGPSQHQHFSCIVEEVDIGTGGDPTSVPGAVLPCVLTIVMGLSRGNVDCSDNGVTPVDSLHILRFDAGLWPAPACIDGGDVNCDLVINFIDALLVLRFDAGLDVSQQPGCTPLGELIPA